MPKPTEQRAYIKALEERVADLERSLALAEGLSEPHDSSRAARLGEPTETSAFNIIRDLTLNASGYSYIGGTSNISLARLLEPAIHHQNASGQPLASSDDSNNDPLVTRNYPRLEAQVSDISPLTDPASDVLFQAYMDQVCTEFPIIHSKKLREMHARRDKPNDLYEVCVLHLVYAIGGITLELVNIYFVNHQEASPLLTSIAVWS